MDRRTLIMRLMVLVSAIKRIGAGFTAYSEHRHRAVTFLRIGFRPQVILFNELGYLTIIMELMQEANWPTEIIGDILALMAKRSNIMTSGKMPQNISTLLLIIYAIKANYPSSYSEVLGVAKDPEWQCGIDPDFCASTTGRMPVYCQKAADDNFTELPGKRLNTLLN